MKSIITLDVPDLDNGNRFFDDNKFLREKYGPGYITVEKENDEQSVQVQKVDECAEKQDNSEDKPKPQVTFG